jgi:hypothetical protein
VNYNQLLYLTFRLVSILAWMVLQRTIVDRRLSRTSTEWANHNSATGEERERVRVIRWSTLAAAVLAVSMYASPVYADSIGPNCGSCFGGIWTLEYSLAGNTPSPTDYNIFYTVDTSGMNASFGNLTTIGFKVASKLVSASVVTSPTGWGTDAKVNQGVSDNGCTNGGNGFLCSQGDTALPIPDGIYTWQFLVDIGNGTLFTGPFAASIKATGSGQGQVLSEGITLQAVPEPTTLLLVGPLLAGVGVWSRRRWLERKAA